MRAMIFALILLMGCAGSGDEDMTPSPTADPVVVDECQGEPVPLEVILDAYHASE